MSKEQTVRVWDPGVRLFHWGLVATFSISYFTGEMHDLHTWAGYTLLGLLLFRLVWGFIGSRHARFRDFLYGPRTLLAYLMGLAQGRPQHYTGHNPAGGWAIFLMLVLLLLIGFTGLKALALEGEGPFAGNSFHLIAEAQAHGNETHNRPAPAPEEPPEQAEVKPDNGLTADSAPSTGPTAPPARPSGEDIFWSESHSLLVDLMLLLVGIHIAGVIVSSLLHRENLVRAMITGNKSTTE